MVGVVTAALQMSPRKTMAPRQLRWLEVAVASSTDVL